MKLEILAALNAERTARRATVVLTNPATGAQRLVKESAIASDPLADLLAERLRSGKSGMAETPDGEVFLAVQVPPVRIVVTGAVHISQALAPMARLLGHDIAVVDPRTAFATPERFPDVPLHAEWPDEVLPKLGMDRYTAFVALTHDPKIDDPGLHPALRSNCFYIGALGSRKTHATRVRAAEGCRFHDDQIGRIRAPIGLNIGAISPAEIALSIVGEITAALRLKPGRNEEDGLTGNWRGVWTCIPRPGARRHRCPFGAAGERRRSERARCSATPKSSACALTGTTASSSRGWTLATCRRTSPPSGWPRPSRARACASSGRSPAAPISTRRWPASSSSAAMLIDRHQLRRRVHHRRHASRMAGGAFQAR